MAPALPPLPNLIPLLNFLPGNKSSNKSPSIEKILPQNIYRISTEVIN
jgi:hypothetical protein